MEHGFFYAIGVAVAAMFPIVNPIGHAPIFYSMTEGDSPGFRRDQALRTSLWVVVILCVSLLFGKWVLEFFDISLDNLRVAGGLLIARSAWAMLGNQSRVTREEHAAADDKEDISLTPMATPILAGPGAMSLAVGMSTYGVSVVHYTGFMIGFVIIGLITLVSFRSAGRIVGYLGVNGTGAVNRILGFFILAIGGGMMLSGARNIFAA